MADLDEQTDDDERDDESKPSSGPVPSDDDLKRERKREQKRAQLAAARANRWKGKGDEKAPKEKAKSDKPAGKGDEKPTISEQAFQLGSAAFVRFLWFLSKFVAWVLGGKLSELTPDEAREGQAEALLLLRRFPFLALLLQFIGLPLWLMRTVTAHFERKPVADEKPKDQKGQGA